MTQSSQEALKKWMPPESEGWIPETLWDEIILPCWLHQGFLVASRETDHGRKEIGWKDIHLLIQLLGRLENQAWKTGRTRRGSGIQSGPKSSQKPIQWDHPWLLCTAGYALHCFHCLALDTNTIPGQDCLLPLLSPARSECTPHFFTSSLFYTSIPTA